MTNPNHFANKSVRQFFEEHPDRFDFIREKFAVIEDDFEIYFEKIHLTAYDLKIELLKFITFIIYRRDSGKNKRKIWTILVVMFLNKFKENYTIRTNRTNPRLCDLRRLIKFIFYGESPDLINLVVSGSASNFLDVEPYTCGVCYEDGNTEAFRCPVCRKAELCASCFSQIPDLCPFCRARIPEADEVQDLTFFHNNQPHTYRFEKIEADRLEIVFFDRFNNRFQVVPVSVMSSYDIATVELMESIESGSVELGEFYDYLTPEARIYFPNSQIFDYWTQNAFPNGVASAIFHACGFDRHPEELRGYIRREIFNVGHSAQENFSQFAGGYFVNTCAVLWWKGINVIFTKPILNSFESQAPLNLYFNTMEESEFFDLEISRI